jgi:hypothetical protein
MAFPKQLDHRSLMVAAQYEGMFQSRDHEGAVNGI